ncbi:LysM peptidoglycan-binding domain-containing protein [Flaviramulus sp. BrNp1-15]|uniref:LysM peptidoglycan-binding domain-containing protein n=1 Tax=Flaviramulus sp. BrNp1-15 TaxID=2916754 RepID=UPI001EE87F7A|nr:LysM peptidoglycan-binding domain-containing protein [Flaviramulus sp. BrNp1-15]ULC58093.1 LysM peptidoglycan-binding domain-containing protein [Flaviramulus sp. BrNp1-15]
MQKSYKLLFCLLVLVLSNALVFAQQKPVYKEVLLNGKPARLNVATGEFIVYGKKGYDTIRSMQVINEVESESEIASDVHIVKKGETLFTLSKKYNLPLDELKRVNNLESNLIHVGQKIRVKSVDAVENSSNTSTIWVVSKGDTLFSISQKTNTSISQIKDLNNIKGNSIFVGQKLRLK